MMVRHTTWALHTYCLSTSSASQESPCTLTNTWRHPNMMQDGWTEDRWTLQREILKPCGSHACGGVRLPTMIEKEVCDGHSSHWRATQETGVAYWQVSLLYEVPTQRCCLMIPDRKWCFLVWGLKMISYLWWLLVAWAAEKFVSKMLAKRTAD